MAFPKRGTLHSSVGRRAPALQRAVADLKAKGQEARDPSGLDRAASDPVVSARAVSDPLDPVSDRAVWASVPVESVSDLAAQVLLDLQAARLLRDGRRRCHIQIAQASRRTKCNAQTCLGLEPLAT